MCFIGGGIYTTHTIELVFYIRSYRIVNTRVEWFLLLLRHSERLCPFRRQDYKITRSTSYYAPVKTGRHEIQNIIFQLYKRKMKLRIVPNELDMYLRLILFYLWSSRR